MEGDIFSATENNKNQIKKQDAAFFQDANFFLQPQQIVINNSTKHINDYDKSILENSAYKNIDDEVFKLEYKINSLEKELKNINNRIQAAKDIEDYSTVEKLETSKKQIVYSLNNLNDLYRESCLSAKITGSVNITPILSNFNFLVYILKLLSKFSKKFSSLLFVKTSLEKLENINKNVDELISMNIPVGEAAKKYDELSKYIVRANSIQSEISKHMKH